MNSMESYMQNTDYKIHMILLVLFFVYQHIQHAHQIQVEEDGINSMRLKKNDIFQ